MKKIEGVKIVAKITVMLALAIILQMGFISKALAGQPILYANDFLFYGQSIVSPGGYYMLIMQHDGNLVLYTRSWHPLWSSGTQGKKGYTVMQGDGNLVMYNWNGQPFWSTSTWENPGAYTTMQDDGNLVVYMGSNPLWASDTWGESVATTNAFDSSVTVTEINYDRKGGDYLVYNMSTPAYKHCAYWCSQDHQCLAFTYVPPRVQGKYARCWLKDRIPNRSPAPGLVSGYIAE